MPFKYTIQTKHKQMTASSTVKCQHERQNSETCGYWMCAKQPDV